jgi:undecaprenyl diphosphate synthase
VETLTQNNDRLTILLALNYGGRSEIVDAARRIMNDPALDRDSLDEKTFSRYLYTADIPDPDLLIRTSGELRVSNFLLWQIAYAEIWITDELWPDFRKKHLLYALYALLDYQKRERRFGDIQANVEHP